MPIIALPIYIGMFIQVNWLIIFIQPKNFGAALTGEIPQPKAKIALCDKGTIALFTDNG